jgi:hypothetical protein
MCKWGDDVPLVVPIDPAVAHDGQFKWAERLIDRCMVPLIEAFNARGMYTTNCCCGHGTGPGKIFFHDGQELDLPTLPLPVTEDTAHD